MKVLHPAEKDDVVAAFVVGEDAALELCDAAADAGRPPCVGDGFNALELVVRWRGEVMRKVRLV